MIRLQDLVDKLQLKVKSYKRQVEESVSYLRHNNLVEKYVQGFLLWNWKLSHYLLFCADFFIWFLLGYRMNKPTFTCPSSGERSMSWKRLKKGQILLSPRSISFEQRAEKFLPPR